MGYGLTTIISKLNYMGYITITCIDLHFCFCVFGVLEYGEDDVQDGVIRHQFF